MSRIRVGVMRGGIGHEYDVSLKTGANVLKHIPSERYEPIDVLITKDGTFHINGFPISLEKLAKNIDVVFNALHGEFGEDGKVQQMLGDFSIPHTGSKAFASAVGMNKALAKEYFKKAGIKTPYGAVVKKGDDTLSAALEIFRSIPPPYVVKPLTSGSSIGLSLTRTFDGLTSAIDYALMYSPAVLVEEYIKGKEVSCGVIDSLDHDIAHPTQPIGITLPQGARVFNYSLKYGDMVKKSCPAELTETEREILQSLAVRAHRGIGMRHYSIADFIVSPRGIYLLEVNSLPGLTDKSLLPFALEASELSLGEFLDHVLTLALHKK